MPTQMELPDRTIAPPIKDASEFEIRLPPCEQFRLDNEVPVYLVRGMQQQTMLLDINFPAGTWYEDHPLQASSTNYLMKNGSLHHNALEIHESVEFFGAYLNRGSSHDYSHYTLHCLEKHLPDLLPLVQEILSEADFPESEIGIYRQNMKQKLAVNLQKCDFVADRLIDAYLFGPGHPYGRYSNAGDYDALSREEMRSFFQTHYAIPRARIFAAGRVPGNFRELMNRYFGQPSDPPPVPLFRKEFPVLPAGEKIYRIPHDPRGVQGAVRVARLVPDLYHPDFPGLKFLNTVLGGYFGSRLMSNIREDKGYTYGIHSSLYPMRQQGALCIQTEAGREVCDQTLREIYGEMDRLTRELIPGEELHLVRNYILGNMLGELDGAFEGIQRWKNLILADLDTGYFDRMIRTFRTIGAEELRELARRYFVREDFFELVVA